MSLSLSPVRAPFATVSNFISRLQRPHNSFSSSEWNPTLAESKPGAKEGAVSRVDRFLFQRVEKFILRFRSEGGAFSVFLRLEEGVGSRTESGGNII
ncbi:hypothetical protein CDAR_35401 [Caerostris darwini]|uniref:Uncharacterized protein n=1 Tax=Caerostris darwini TaxID=1538125 RepID=A0AAV4SPN8_9ARAC|nr:hypothetical protein CDAR_35401 [Caerostris darwini]